MYFCGKKYTATGLVAQPKVHLHRSGSRHVQDGDLYVCIHGVQDASVEYLISDHQLIESSLTVRTTSFPTVEPGRYTR